MPSVLVDIGHPAHVHLFKHLIRRLQRHGVEVFVTARKKDISIELLEEEKIEFKHLGNNHPGLTGKIKNLLEYDFLLYKYSKSIKPDIFISHSSIYAAHTAFLLGKKCITLEDTGNADQSLLYRPFTDIILTPECLRKNYGRKQKRYKAYHELAYLHPHYFVPVNNIFGLLNLPEGQQYILIRFVSRGSSHDVGIKGINAEGQIKVAEELSQFAKVFITSERPLPSKLQPFQLKIPYSEIHHAIYYASLVFGESATMSSEAAVLGTPSVFLDKIGRYYTREQEEKYGLVFNFTRNQYDLDKALEKAKEILTSPHSKEYWREKSKKLVEDSISLTDFMFDLVISELKK